MRTKLLHKVRGQRTFAIAFDAGDEASAGLQEVAITERLSAAHFTAIGAFSSVTLGFFDLGLRDYRRISVGEQCEVVSLVGNVALDGDTRKIHAHAVVAKSDGTTLGGHLLEGHVQPTLEVVMVESPRHLRRKPDPATGLALLDLSR